MYLIFYAEMLPPINIPHGKITYEQINCIRFGKSNDLAQLMTKEITYSNYIYGAAFIPAAILVIFVLWLLMIGVFKCCGVMTCCGKRIGILSGRRLKDFRKHWFVRTLVMLSAAFAVAAGAMYLMKATTSLYSTFGSIRDGANVSIHFKMQTLLTN